ncbi:MAG TPA: phosphoribosyltransferase family protein [Candidatus Nitrosotenuis sp.]|jgi:predicted phosphoribosyltransferase|nr:phosphoribosyltransferase family protein [Candidatus Nitrosotenuis sp.]
MIQDRLDAARLLAEKLDFAKGKDCVVLAIPRGGVIVGDEIARILGLPLDVIIAKKITPPDYPEYAVGAVTFDGVMYYGPDWERWSTDPNFEQEIQQKKAEVVRQLETYRGSMQYQLEDKSVILVDDGVATGATIRAILEWLSKKKAREVILAVPVIPYTTYEILKKFGIKIVAVEIPTEFSSVGQFYRRFEQVPEQTVIDILQRHRK